MKSSFRFVILLTLALVLLFASGNMTAAGWPSHNPLGHYQLNFPEWRSHYQCRRVGLRIGGRPHDNSDQWLWYLPRWRSSHRWWYWATSGPVRHGERHV